MKLAILGFGVVGKGVYELVRKTPGLECTKVLVLPTELDAPYKTSDFSLIVNDAEIELVVEAIGGIDAPYEFAKKTLCAGKSFVSSNKALVAAHGPELEALARERNVAFLFSAACGGGIPYLRNLAAARYADSIEWVGGILNGTTNFILDAVEGTGRSYEAVLAEAQSLGYAEKDPTADVSGLDTLRKLALACLCAYGKLFDADANKERVCEGITNIGTQDFAYFKAQKLKLRLWASAGMNEDGSLYATVEPTLFAETELPSGVSKNFNLACYQGAANGRISLYGQGAGRYPTAQNVLMDVLEAMNGKKGLLPERLDVTEINNEGTTRRYYLRVDDAAAQLVEASPEKMHGYVRKLRKEGRNVCFAAVNDAC